MTHADDLRAWAKGMYALEARTELLLRAFNGHFAAPGNPWIHPSSTTQESHLQRAWIDFEAIPDHAEAGGYSGGERRLLLLAASFGAEAPVVLSDVLPDLDRANVELILAAVSHAAGSHSREEYRISFPRFQGHPEDTRAAAWAGVEPFVESFLLEADGGS